MLGNGSTENSAVPVPVSGGLVFGALSAGVSHMCGMTAAAEPIVYWWGDNTVGQLGDTSLGVASTPVEVTGQRYHGGA